MFWSVSSAAAAAVVGVDVVGLFFFCFSLYYLSSLCVEGFACCT